ncbi:MAG TPA: hypothetical protein QGF43_02240 [Acidimicrobiales bacterium]|jgi:hypothetical protein|nr:hypothetical protein [Actinomycetota bacterium]MDP6176236.1 hypothetical protein [Acidimicrobiales bacterium]MDP6281497.1 hypothetical protein [Acidimicrobiales bacterium]MDP7117330.1 hypothetical protein [Acidimicrobiales bacterium]MDP7411276.1 hypothetical protein [Acidimicrobiales bacterium]|tara:strand:+ start:11344 stop:12162 length:819 start_codon:yes stop_codon:yes gene_type:complete
MKPRKYAVVLLALATALTACGSDATGVEEELIEPATTMAGVMATMEMADHEVSDKDMGDHGHGSHQHGMPIDLTDLSSRPGVSLVAEADGLGGIMLDIGVLGLELVPANPPADHRLGQGHVHVAVDGASVAMIAETNYHVTGLTDGSHTVMVTLSSNDHRDYHVDGSAIGAMAMVEVTGGKPAVQPDVRFEVDVEGGKVAGGIYRFEASVGDLVEITVRSNVADDVHLHVYDLKVPVHEGMPAVLLVEVDIAGVFEGELHGAGFKLFELTVS